MMHPHLSFFNHLASIITIVFHGHHGTFLRLEILVKRGGVLLFLSTGPRASSGAHLTTP